MIAGVNIRANRVTYKHGDDLPTSVVHTKRLDGMNGNTQCMGIINKEI